MSFVFVTASTGESASDVLLENYQLALRVIDAMAVQVDCYGACSFENEIGGHEVPS